MVSKDVHDFMFAISLPKNNQSEIDKLRYFYSKSNGEIFKLGFAVGYTLDLEPSTEKRNNDISIRGFPIEAYRTFLEDEAKSNKCTIGNLLGSYADAGLRYLKSHLESGLDIIDLFESLNT